MAELSTEQRNRLKDDQFAYVDKDGERHLPIHDEEHVRNAIARFGRTHFESKAANERAAKAILKAAKKHDVDVGEDDDVTKAAGSTAVTTSNEGIATLPNLVPGRYTIEATYDGRTKRQEVTVGHGHQKVGFLW